MVPTAAFKKKDADYFVYVVQKDKKAQTEKQDEDKESVLDTGVVEIRQVEISYLTQDKAEIGKGLTEGELIIAEAYQDFTDKARVEITEEQETLF